MNAHFVKVSKGFVGILEEQIEIISKLEKKIIDLETEIAILKVTEEEASVAEDETCADLMSM